MKAKALTRDLGGVFVIAPSPFREDDEIDWDSIGMMADYLCDIGVDGVTILGIAGEAGKMTETEAVAFVERFATALNQRLPLVVGISNPVMASAVKLGRRSMELGASGVMFQPSGPLQTDADVLRYMRAVLMGLGSDVPMVYQDYPQVSGVPMTFGNWEALVSEFEQIVMIKHEQVPGLTRLLKLRELERERGLKPISVMVGNNANYLPYELARGANGAMTGFAFPDMLSDVLAHWNAGDAERATDLFDAYLPLMRYELQPGYGLAVRKELLVRRGAIRFPKVRYPGSTMSDFDRTELDTILERLRRRLGELGETEKL